ncbi:Zinc finger with UFM1-specific peptidase domain protein [Ophiophagus hannah]|uniref:Zinc finger with UFM1-specific peptidase domain protein n=1 Tax=Ophiophagus hannah TaxID=8665 RepID=V8NPU2_OPHHA|nr:Zinc finger with UFM1-specific peptidase domain protein [Ophiophagus hannah]
MDGSRRGRQASPPSGVRVVPPSPLPESGLPVYECPICHLSCTDYPVLQEHVELHLDECSILEGRNLSDLELAQHLQNEEDRHRRTETGRQEKDDFQKLQRQYGLDGSGGYKQQSLKAMAKEVDFGRMQPSDYHRRKADMLESLALGVDDGKTKTSGITETLCQYYQNECKDIKHVWLSTGVDHFHCSLGDKGWGCGYRNFQILFSSLLRNNSYKDCLKGLYFVTQFSLQIKATYFKLDLHRVLYFKYYPLSCLDISSVPCIPKIQTQIEDAWKEGFDPQGASHFNSKLQGTKAWIGACEIYSLLTFLRLKCQIIDFHQPTGSSGTHPCLFEWVLNYYSSGKDSNGKVMSTSKPPIYLQHQGHSRTIVGIEERKNKSLCLLIFDPGCPSEEMQKLLKGIDGNNLKLFRRLPGGLKHKQYQIVSVEGVLTEEEKVARRQASQFFTAQKIP